MYILSGQRKTHDSTTRAFDAYRSYVQTNKQLFPPGAIELAQADWYFNASDHRCPHDAWLETAELSEQASGERQEVRSTRLVVRLLGAYHDGHVVFVYPAVLRYELENRKVGSGHRDWLYDQFRPNGNGGVIHEIEWSDGARWLIESSDITFEWRPFNK